MKQPEIRVYAAGDQIQIHRHTSSYVHNLMFCLRSHSHFSSPKFILILNRPNNWTPSQTSFTMTEFKQSLILYIAAVFALTSNAVNALSATLVRLHKSQSCSFVIWRLLFFLKSLFSNILAIKSIVPPKKRPLLLFSGLQWWELWLHLWGENECCQSRRRNISSFHIYGLSPGSHSRGEYPPSIWRILWVDGFYKSPSRWEWLSPAG